VSGDTRARPALQFAAVCWFSALAVAVSFPLILHLDTHIAGTGAGDNVAFLWNFWWFRYALDEPGARLFFTGHLFAPYGTSLVLHTHTALPAVVGATFLGGAPVVAAHNLVLLMGLAANGACTYALAFHQTRRQLPAVLAGTIFAASAWVSIRLLGHFNLVHAWVVPLALLAWIRWTEAPTFGRGILVAAAFAAAAYTDYYYLTFAVIACAVFTCASTWHVAPSWGAPRSSVLSHAILALAAAISILVMIALATGGVRLDLGSMRISISSLRNPFAGLWLLAVAWMALRVRIGIKGRPAAPDLRPYVPSAAVALVLLTVLVLPLAISAVRLMLSGDYVSPAQVWRSGPRGVDLLTLVAGNPLNPLYGHVTRSAYARAGIDLMEQTAWLGLVPVIVLLAFARTRRARDGAGYPWWIVAMVFLVWALGAHLILGGLETGLPMPQILARFVPVLSNARIPGRAMVMVQLAAAMLCASAVIRLRWKPVAILSLIALSAADGSAAPIPLYQLPKAGAIESLLARGRDAAVVELPAGLRDGFGEVGRMDHRALVHQMTHQRPLVGGFVARLSPRLRHALLDMAELSALLKFSSGDLSEGDLPDDLGGKLAAAGITHVVVNTDLMPGATRATLESRGLRLIAVEGTRELYLAGVQ
jgi:hypothetical protein